MNRRITDNTDNPSNAAGDEQPIMNAADRMQLAAWRKETRDRITCIMSNPVVRITTTQADTQVQAEWISWIQSLVTIGEEHKHELYHGLAADIIAKHKHNVIS